MSRRSGSKENINTSYYDLTSPLSNLEKAKQKSLLKSSIHNSFTGKIQIYSQNDVTNLPKASLKSDPNYINLKAGSQVYKLPEFTVPEINYEISQAIKQKTSEIKEQIVTNLSNILGSSHSLPSLVPKSSNYNPKKLENVFGHRSSIMELEKWIKNSLKNSLPTTPEQLIEYKQMIMGVGMKELIRIINLRCLEQGKLVEQVWELTWGICKQIIQHMALRARKCEQILTQQIIEFNQGCKRNYFQKEKQLIELRKKVKEYEQEKMDMTSKMQEVSEQNQRLRIQSNRNYMSHNYVNEEFLNVLQENLAMYLHLGDKSKRDWVKKMYKQVAKSRDSIKNAFKEKVNRTMSNRMRKEESFGDLDQKQLRINEQGNFIVQSEKAIKQNGQNYDDEKKSECNELKEQLLKEFELKEAEIQTDTVDMVQFEVQYEGAVYEQKQTSTQTNPLQEIGINTEIDSGENNNKNKQLKDPKLKKQKSTASKPQMKAKISKRYSLAPEIIENKLISVSPSNQASNLKGLRESEGQKSQCVQICQYTCKECFVKKSQEDALIEIQFEEEQEIIKKEKAQMKKIKNDSSSQNDSQVEKSPLIRKNTTKNKTYLGLASIKQSNRDENSLEKSKVKRMLSNIEEIKNVEDNQSEGQTTERVDNNDGYPEFPVDPNMNPNRRKNHRRDSSLLHDIGIKKEIEQQKTSNFKDAVYNFIKSEQEEKNVVAKLPLCSKEPYFKFFTEQITEANKDLINDISLQQNNNENVLNNYFNIVQEVNCVPDAKIQMSDKQMLTTIEKNLMPIILQLLNNVKKSVLKKTVDQTMRNFHSLPFILMNKFSTKYGVKILAIKNMKLLLSSLKKIELTTDRYKSIRLMLFTDCRAMYSEDLFVYLLVLALVTPHLDIEKTISYEEVTEVREICEKYLTTEKRVYQEFDNMTKDALSFNNNQAKFGNLKLAPLLRSIITSYRMVKINRIEEVGFLFLMLKKENFVEYATFSYFLSCFKIVTETKVRIVKNFLANCDFKGKNKKVAISESGFSKFLIRCPEFNFEFLNASIQKQKSEINRSSQSILTKKKIPGGKRISEQISVNHFKSFGLLKNEDEILVGKLMVGRNEQSQLQTEKAILMASQRQLARNTEAVQEYFEAEKLDSNRISESVDLKNEEYEKAQMEELDYMMARNQKRHTSLNTGNKGSRWKGQVSQKVRHYSYFTYEICKFMEKEEQTKYMTVVQKEFVWNYLIVHVMACEVEEVIGIVDYFSNDMLEIVCFDTKDLQIQ